MYRNLIDSFKLRILVDSLSKIRITYEHTLGILIK